MAYRWKCGTLIGFNVKHRKKSKISSKILSKCKSTWPVNVNYSILRGYLSNQPTNPPPEELFNCLNRWFGHYWDFDTTFGHGMIESIEIGFQGWRLSFDFWQIAHVVRYRINFWAVTLICLVTKGKTKIKRLWKKSIQENFFSSIRLENDLWKR